MPIPGFYKILIVDENQSSLDYLKAVISNHINANIIEACNGEDAIKVFPREDIDIAFINCKLPVIDGFATARLMKKNKKTENIPIIFISDMIYCHELEEKAYQVGAVDFLIKPVNELQLINRLKVYLKLIEKERVLRLDMKNELERANNIKDLFLANISHELRTPMNGIMGMLQLLEFSQLDDEQKEIVSMMRESSIRMMGLLKNLISVTTLETGKTTINNCSFQVADFICNIVKPYSELAKSRDLDLSFYIDKALPKVLIGDEEKIAKILWQMLDNAFKFTTKGGVILEIFEDEEESNETGLINVIFSVRDTGIGIDAEDLNKLFVKFTQLDDTYTKKYQGAGLGLSICEKLANIMDGKIIVESKINRGSTFKLKLQLKAEGVDMKDDTTGDSDFKILAVDDDEVSLKLIKLICQRIGYHILTASNGREALELYDKNDIDIVFMDIQMPDVSGIELTKLMRSRKQERVFKTVFIAVTAYALNSDREKFLQCGMDDYISKPVDINKFNKLLIKWTS